MLVQYGEHFLAQKKKKSCLASWWRAFHSAVATAVAIRQLKFEPIPHDPMYPELAPSGYYLFGPLREEAFRGPRFASDCEV